jgi:hypothetical protein
MRGGKVLLDGAPRECLPNAGETLKTAYVEPTDVMKIAQALP